jgi:hypothetical protein
MLRAIQECTPAARRVVRVETARCVRAFRSDRQGRIAASGGWSNDATLVREHAPPVQDGVQESA